MRTRRAWSTSFVGCTHVRRDPEPFIESQAPPEEASFIPEHLDPAGFIDGARALLPWTVLPCWVLVLLFWKVRREGMEGVAALKAVHAEAARRIDYLPGLGWMTCVLGIGGTPALRKRLAERLFKFPRDDPHRDAPGAAWDLGYLQLLSIARAPALEQVFDGRTPVLVTADRGLSELAVELVAVGNTGGFEISADRLDPRASDDVLDFLEMAQIERLARIAQGDARPPAWSACVRAIGALEQELGMEATEIPDLEAQPRRIPIDTADVQRWLTVLDAVDGSAALHRIVELLEQGHELVAPAIVTLSALLRDNAKARGTSVDEAWRAMRDGLPDGADRVQTVSALSLAVRAAMDGQWSLAIAWLGKLSAHGGAETAELWLWAMTRSLLTSTLHRCDTLSAVRMSADLVRCAPQPGEWPGYRNACEAGIHAWAVRARAHARDSHAGAGR